MAKKLLQTFVLIAVMTLSASTSKAEDHKAEGTRVLRAPASVVEQGANPMLLERSNSSLDQDAKMTTPAQPRLGGTPNLNCSGLDWDCR